MKPAVILILLLTPLTSLKAQQPVNYNDVAVVINQNSATSVAIGTYFQQKRNIRPENLIYINTTINEEIDTNTYKQIRQQIESYLVNNNLKDSINYIVTTKGVPLRISRGNCDSITFGTFCTSVDAELTLLFDSYTKVNIPNPYRNAQQNFSRKNYGIYLVTRLDGYNLGDVLNLIDRSGTGIKVNQNQAKFIFDISFVYDTTNLKVFKSIFQPAIDTLSAKGWQSIFHPSTPFLTDQTNVVGYQGLIHESVNTSVNFEWIDGAIAELAFVRTAPSFTYNSSWKFLSVADLVEEGVTGAHGYVGLVFFTGLLNSAILFDAYTDTQSRYNLAESYYMAMSVIASPSVVIGDPKTSIAIDNTVLHNGDYQNGLLIYPNPGDGNYTIKTDSPINSIKFYNAIGQLVVASYEFYNSKRMTVDLSIYAPGVYFIHLETEDGLVNGKLIKK